MAEGATSDADTSSSGKTAPSLGVKLSYGVGSAAFGVKDQGFQIFLLLFYSQVIGVNAGLVGLALTLALVLDAISDPIVGYWSDRTRSRWGRRHPFMVASAVPTALFFVLVWNPPQGWSEVGLFWWLLATAVLTRTAITFFETPSSALAPELTQDYVGRSVLLSYRSSFGWIAGNAMTVIMFGALFPAFVTQTISNGQFNREAYELYSWIAGGVILGAIIICCLGTWGEIPRLRAPQGEGPKTLGGVFREIWEVLSNRSFTALLLAAMVAALALGLGQALSVYMSTYFWKFSSQQISLLTLAIFVTAVMGASLAPMVTRTLGKKTGAITLALVSGVASPVLMILRIAGVLDPADPSTFCIVFVVSQVDLVLTVCVQVLLFSMIADISEDTEVKTGRRNEGVVFAANTFIAKMVTGVGVLAASLVLGVAGIAAGARPDQVPEEALLRLGTIYIPAIVGLRLLMIALLFGYRISRKTHEENLAKLQAR